MELLQEPLIKRCLALTGAFETSKSVPECFSGLAGDFDGMGLSFGALQWNLGQGTLQPMLQAMLASHENVVTSVFGSSLSEVRKMLALPRPAQLEWAQSIQDRNRHTVQEPWKACFVTLGQTEEFQTIQMAHADSIHQDALALCRRFSLVTERALALMFDIRVQNGGIGNAVEGKIRDDFAKIPVIVEPMPAETLRLQSIANRRAEAANPKFIEDVRTRKLTIANGEGTVHGVVYNLEPQFGIRLLPMQG
jgi:hypothetical protein